MVIIFPDFSFFFLTAENHIPMYNKSKGVTSPSLTTSLVLHNWPRLLLKAQSNQICTYTVQCSRKDGVTAIITG